MLSPPVASLESAASFSQKDPEKNVHRLAAYRPSPYQITSVFLDIVLDPERTVVRGTLSLQRNGAVPLPLVLLGEGLLFRSGQLDGKPLTGESFDAAAEHFVLHAPPERPFTLHLEVEISPRNNTQLMGLYLSNRLYCTQCEPEGFRRIFYFLDRPDVLSVYTTRIEASHADCPILLSNGNLKETGLIPGTDRHFAIWEDPFPKPCYLFALVAGALTACTRHFTTATGRDVTLKIYTEGDQSIVCEAALDALLHAFSWDEVVFGCAYDLDLFMIVAVADFNMGAMENKGLNIFSDRYLLADPEIATDLDYDNIERVVAHEYFHNWTGNRITCRDWFQLCLKEGLTVFRDQEFSAAQRGAAVRRIEDVRILRSVQFPEDAGPLAHPVRPERYEEINNFYTATVYEKGAEIIRMLRTLIGPMAFKRGMDLYLTRHDGQAVTIEQFLACFAETARCDLTQFFRWYTQPGTPHLSITEEWDAAQGRFTLRITQTRPPLPGFDETHKPRGPLVIPLRFSLLGKEGSKLPVLIEQTEKTEKVGTTRPTAVYGPCTPYRSAEDLLVLTDEQHVVTFTGLKERPVVSLLRGFSAPITLETNQEASVGFFLLQHDDDAFNRWQAGQSLLMRCLLARLSSQPKKNQEADLAAILAECAENENLDPAFRALLLQLPSDSDILQALGGGVDPDAVQEARRALAAHLAQGMHSCLRDLVEQCQSPVPYSPDPHSTALRSLRNAALALWAYEEDPSRRALVTEYVQSQFKEADNMTDRLAALTLLLHHELEGAEEACDAFYARHAHKILAVDKWFRVQATAPLFSTLERVEKLTQHPQFTLATPNRVYALLHAFASANITQFHRADGKGYAFIANQILILDRLNPQVAARLLTSFRSWNLFEPVRQSHAQRVLQNIQAQPTLSSDLHDLVTRCLAGAESGDGRDVCSGDSLV